MASIGVIISENAQLIRLVKRPKSRTKNIATEGDFGNLASHVKNFFTWGALAAAPHTTTMKDI